MNIYFRKSDSTTVDGQKIIGGIAERDLKTVDGLLELERGAPNPCRGARGQAENGQQSADNVTQHVIA